MQTTNNNDKLETRGSCSIGLLGRKLKRLSDFDGRRNEAAQLLAASGQGAVPLWRLLPIYCLVILGLLVGQTSATTVLPLSIEETVRQAEDIAVGTVKSAASRWGDATHRWMVTDYTVSVEEVLHGQNTTVGKGAVLTYWGGTIGGETQAIADMRTPQTGERVLVMLRASWQQPGFTPVVGLNQGLFIASSNAAGGPQIVYSSEGQTLSMTTQGVRLGPPTAPSTSAPTSALDLATFKRWIRANLTQIKSQPSEL